MTRKIDSQGRAGQSSCGWESREKRGRYADADGKVGSSEALAGFVGTPTRGRRSQDSLRKKARATGFAVPGERLATDAVPLRSFPFPPPQAASLRLCDRTVLALPKSRTRGCAQVRSHIQGGRAVDPSFAVAGSSSSSDHRVSNQERKSGAHAEQEEVSRHRVLT